VRSIGTAIAPAIMIGFLAHAGMAAQSNLMALLPPVESPRLESAVKLQAQLEALKKDPQAATMLAKMSIPSFDTGSAMKFDMTGGGGLPPEIAARLRNADVTTIVDDLKALSLTMFELKTPAVIEKITQGLGKGLVGIDQALASMDKSAAGLSGGLKGMDAGLAGIDAGLAGIDAALSRAKAPPQIEALKAQRAILAGNRDDLAAKKAGMAAGAAGIAAGRSRLAEVRSTMLALQGEVAPAFTTSKDGYLAQLEAMRPRIEETFRSSLNAGFRQMYITVAVASVAAGIVLALYRTARRKEEAGALPAAVDHA